METQKNTKKNSKAHSADPIEDRLCLKADDASRRFIGELGRAIVALPKIKETSRDKAEKKCFRILDNLFKAFVKAQSEVYKAVFYSTLNQLSNSTK
ncbi:MAG: hypothetical protein J6Q22_09670 [Prevotella sp.]|nr:hypothetical protein [Prevotella sp.]